MKYLRMLICEIAKSTQPDLHRMLNGKMVKFGCDACINDLEYRIEDAKHQRDDCDHRSDSREHYNGILKVLRRQLRGARKLSGGL